MFWTMLFISIFILFNAVPAAAFLCLCSLLAIWLAIGRMHVVFRMPLFLLGTLPLGLAACLASSKWDAFEAYVLGAFLIAVSVPRTHILFQLPPFVAGAAYTLAVPYRLGSTPLDSSMMVRMTLAITFVSCVLATLRWCGFRFVDLTDGIPGLEMEQGTGRDLDQWIAYLDNAGARELNHAEVMALLRTYGLSFAWQKTVTVAYQIALGRRAVGRSKDGSPELVVEHESRGLFDWLTRSTNQQFSIWQMMLLTFCAANLLGFARNFAWSAPTLHFLTTAYS